MDESSPRRWQLRHGKTPLGDLTETELDFPRIYSTFTPTQEFARFQPYVAQLDAAWKAEDREQRQAHFEQARQQLWAQRLTLFPLTPTAAPLLVMGEVLLSITGTEAIFRISSKPTVRSSAPWLKNASGDSAFIIAHSNAA